MPDRVEVVYIIVVEGHTKPLEKPFADCWPIGAFVTTEDCDGEHWGPCGLHVIATRRLSAVRFMDKAECRHRLAVLTANFDRVRNSLNGLWNVLAACPASPDERTSMGRKAKPSKYSVVIRRVVESTVVVEARTVEEAEEHGLTLAAASNWGSDNSSMHQTVKAKLLR